MPLSAIGGPRHSLAFSTTYTLGDSKLCGIGLVPAVLLALVGFAAIFALVTNKTQRQIATQRETHIFGYSGRALRRGKERLMLHPQPK